MDLPGLRHFRDGGIFSDPVDVLVGEAWVQAVYSDRGWLTSDGTKLENIQEWRNAQENGQEPEKSSKSAARVQGRRTAQRQTGTRKRTNR